MLAEEPWYQAVSASVGRRRLGAGQVLFRQGEAVFGLFLVVAGQIRLVRNTSEGCEVVVYRATATETFAEAALFSEIYHCDAVADMPSEVAVLPKAEVLRAMQADPAAALAFMARLARQVQGLRSRLEIRNIRSATERVHQFLLLCPRDGAGEIRLAGTLKDMAAQIGLTHEALYRALAALTRQGRISRHGRAIRLCDPAPYTSYRYPMP